MWRLWCVGRPLCLSMPNRLGDLRHSSAGRGSLAPVKGGVSVTCTHSLMKVINVCGRQNWKATGPLFSHSRRDQNMTGDRCVAGRRMASDIDAYCPAHD